MATLRDWFNGFTKATGETVDEVVFRRHPDWDDAPHGWPGIVDGEVVAAGEIPASVLDHLFDDGYGGRECWPFFAWSKSFVIWPHEYDGAEWPAWAPRQPTGKFNPHHSALGPSDL